MLSHPCSFLQVLQQQQQQQELPLDTPLWAQLCLGFPREEGEEHRGSSLSFVLLLPPTSAPCAAPGDLSPLPWMPFKGSSWG